MTIALTEFAGKTVAIMGLGKAGLVACQAVKAGGGHVKGWDDNPAIRTQHPDFIADLRDDGQWHDIEALIVSPGIPPHHIISAKARLHDIPVFGEASLLYRHHPEAYYIGITGTNGKSTTTALIGHILSEAGKNCFMGGNLGRPALDFDPPGAQDFCILEMSSFQLLLSPDIRFDSAILLNISPDHLDYHGSMHAYIDAKLGIFARLDEDCRAIISFNDMVCRAIAKALITKNLKVIPFAIDPLMTPGVFIRHGLLIDSQEGAEEEVMSLEGLPHLRGEHNQQNIVAAYIACQRAGLASEEIRTGIESFPGLAHRQQYVARAGHIDFINDSKATNPASAMPALKSYENIYWIAGGRLKEKTSLEPVRDCLSSVQHGFFIGEAADRLYEIFSPHIQCQKAENLEKAFHLATHKISEEKAEKATILLSPACASYDQFDNFEARGQAFNNLASLFAEKQKRLENEEQNQ